MKSFAVAKSVSGLTGKIGFQMKRYAPELLLTAGISAGIGGTVMACVATVKAMKVVDHAKENIEAIHKCQEGESVMRKDDGSACDQEELKRYLTAAYMNLFMSLAMAYAPAVMLGGVSVSCILASNNVMRKRNASLAAAYATIAGTFKDYQNRVREKLGEEAERDIRYDVREDEVEETVINEKGKEKKVKKTVKSSYMDGQSSYARFFDDGCEGWDENPEYSLMFLRAQQQYANDKLQAQGYLFLNDVYELFGIPKTQAGQVVGWLYNKDGNPNGDNYVDLGLYNLNNRSTRRFVNGHENVFIIDPNVDGPILDKAFDIEIRNM